MPLDPTKTAFKESAGKDWALLPEDTYQVQITDIAEKESEYKGEKKQILQFEFTVIEQHEFQDAGRKCYTYGRKLWKKGSIVKPVPSDNNKDPLTYKVCSAVSGKKLTKEEGEAWTIDKLNTLIGKQLRIGVSISAPRPDGKQFNNVDLFYAVKQPMLPFDESKVKEDEPKPDGPVKTDVIAETLGIDPNQPDDVEFGTVDPEDIPL
jgi:hypothetical protein